MSVPKFGGRFFFPVLGAIGAIGAASLAFKLFGPQYDPTKTFNSGRGWVDLKLKDSWNISHDTKRYVFELIDPEQSAGFTTASCLIAKCVTSEGKTVIRPYTPISDPEQKGTIEFVIKTYPDGKFSKHLYDLKPNDSIKFRGAFTKWKWEPNSFKKIVLIGGGSGITPLYQLINEIRKNPEDKTQIDLYYGSKSEKDILLKEELDKIVAENKDQIKVEYFVSKPEDKWTGRTGHIDKEFLKENLPGPSEDTKIFVCGPDPLYEAICGKMPTPIHQGKISGILSELGYTKKHVYKL